MMDELRLGYFRDIERTCQRAGLAVAKSNSKQHGWFKTLRVYEKEEDKGHPDRAIYETDRLNREVVGDIKLMVRLFYSDPTDLYHS